MTDGMVQLVLEAKQTPWQVFNLFVHGVNELKASSPTVTGVIVHSLNQMIRLGLAGMSCEMLVKVLKWLFSEAQDGKDVCDRVIGTEKGHMECWVNQRNEAATAEQLCEGLSHMDTLPGNHKSFALEPTH